MDINERIKSISQYLVTFNIQEGVACLVAKFPDKWTLFDAKTIGDEFNIVIEERQDGVFFVCSIADGFDGIFNAIDFIIEQNKDLEMKSELLREKVNQLKSLFEQEPLDRLRTLRFVFPNEKEANAVINEPLIPVDVKAQLKNKKTKPAVEPKATEVVTTEEKEETIIEKPKKTSTKKQKHKEGDSSLMDFAKNLVENE